MSHLLRSLIVVYHFLLQIDSPSTMTPIMPGLRLLVGYHEVFFLKAINIFTFLYLLDLLGSLTFG